MGESGKQEEKMDNNEGGQWCKWWLWIQIKSSGLKPAISSPNIQLSFIFKLDRCDLIHLTNNIIMKIGNYVIKISKGTRQDMINKKNSGNK